METSCSYDNYTTSLNGGYEFAASYSTENELVNVVEQDSTLMNERIALNHNKDADKKRKPKRTIRTSRKSTSRKPVKCNTKKTKLTGKGKKNNVSHLCQGNETVPLKSKKKNDRKLDGLNATSVLEESVEQVKERFALGCECQEESCFKNVNPEFVYKHRLNIAELTRTEHDMYLMGVTMASLSNPEETARHTERKRLRTQYVFQGKKICLDAFLYLENCTQYQLKRIRKHIMTHGVTPRVHGNHGKRPHNTFSLDIYQHTTAFLQTYIQRYATHNTSHKGKAKERNHVIYLPPDITRKTVHSAYREYMEHFEPGTKVMGYSTFRHFMKRQFPQVRFMEVNKIGTAHASSSEVHLSSNEMNANSHVVSLSHPMSISNSNNTETCRMNTSSLVSSNALSNPLVLTNSISVSNANSANTPVNLRAIPVVVTSTMDRSLVDFTSNNVAAAQHPTYVMTPLAQLGVVSVEMALQ